MTEQTNQQPESNFAIQRIFAKDISFETPNSPIIFSKEWKPEVNLEMNSSSNQLAENVFEVILRVTVTTKSNDEIAYICEVTQAGIFTINGLDEGQLAHCLGAYCPNLLFPFVRETVSGLVNKGTFPVINLEPINFDAAFANYMQQKAQHEQADNEPTIQ
ncbi:protein-export chaperone SecB [Utexia brackfieldae]|uniref:protein-export chaperone SecB n=1 Tax=Utexia brackfieldae TaxID=3074108 RepID=UPI00370D87E5